MTAQPTPDSPSRRVPALAQFRRAARAARPDCVILHYTGMPTAEGALALLRDPASEVSAHYFVWEDGESRSTRRRGQARLARRRRLLERRARPQFRFDRRSRSSIPATTAALPPFPARADRRASSRCAATSRRGAPFAPERVLAHSDIAPERKRDPGEKFPWDALARAGIGHWAEPAPIVGGATHSARAGGTARPGAAGDARALRLRRRADRRL